jgi:hypothetical protein
VQGVRLVRFAAVVTNGRFAKVADLDVVGAEVAGAFDALLVSLVRAVGAGTLHEVMLHGGRALGKPKIEIGNLKFEDRRVSMGRAARRMAISGSSSV